MNGRNLSTKTTITVVKEGHVKCLFPPDTWTTREWLVNRKGTRKRMDSDKTRQDKTWKGTKRTWMRRKWHEVSKLSWSLETRRWWWVCYWCSFHVHPLYSSHLNTRQCQVSSSWSHIIKTRQTDGRNRRTGNKKHETEQQEMKLSVKQEQRTQKVSKKCTNVTLSPADEDDNDDDHNWSLHFSPEKQIDHFMVIGLWKRTWPFHAVSFYCFCYFVCCRWWCLEKKIALLVSSVDDTRPLCTNTTVLIVFPSDFLSLRHHFILILHWLA